MEEVRINGENYIKTNCSKCGKEILRKKHFFNHQMKISKTGKPYCSSKCALEGIPRPEELKQKLSNLQKGVSVMSRGRKGRVVDSLTRQRIRNAKLGKKSPKDWDLMRKEVDSFKNSNSRVIPLIKPVPDGILFKDGKIIALEVEKEPAEYGIREKMKLYDDVTYFDEVIVVWYRDNERVCQFRKTNGEWIRE